MPSIRPRDKRRLRGRWCGSLGRCRRKLPFRYLAVIIELDVNLGLLCIWVGTGKNTAGTGVLI